MLKKTAVLMSILTFTASARAAELEIPCGISSADAQVVALSGLACLVGRPLTRRNLTTGNGPEVGIRALRGYVFEQGRITHALMSVIHDDPVTGEFTVLAQSAAPMFYDPATLDLEVPVENLCATPLFLTLRAVALRELSDMTRSNLEPSALPLCLQARADNGLEMVIFRGFTRSPSGSGKMGSALMSWQWFDPKTGLVIDSSNSASGGP